MFAFLYAQEEWMEWQGGLDGMEDEAGWQERQEELSELAAHPFNINTATKEQLEQLPFLSDKMIENILYYLYKYGPMVSENELLGVEGMDWQTRKFLSDFIYVETPENEEEWEWRNIWKWGRQELLARIDVPMNMKSGYADHDAETLEKYPNRKYLGDPLYHQLRYRFRYRDKLSFGILAEKDAGECFFTSPNRKGYDFYSVHLFLKDYKRWKAVAAGHYRVSFGYGLVVNTCFRMGKSGAWSELNRMGQGISRYTSANEADYLQGAAATYRLADRWSLSAFYSFRRHDARVDGMFIRSLKTDGYHRLKKDMEKKNTAHNHLVGSNLSYNGKHAEYGFTVVYNVFNKVLNPDFRPYNRYYPRGKSFCNAGVHYKFFLNDKFVLSGETAVDKCFRFATLNMLSYSPDVHTSLFVMNRYYDKRYQAVYSRAFAENSHVQNECGIYIGMETSLLNPLKISCHGDFFYFPYKRYRVDKDRTGGMEGVFQMGYSHKNSLSVLVKYACKSKARNYDSAGNGRFVLPFVRQRLHGQVQYSPCEQWMLKTVAEYVRAGYRKQVSGHGVAVGETVRMKCRSFPLQATLSGVWFRTDTYDSRIYMYEPGMLYAFSMMSFHGKGTRLAVNLQYACKRKLTFRAKWGWTRYADRETIGSGTEEIQGNDKADLLFQLGMKF